MSGIEFATFADLEAIAALNVSAYREFSDRMADENWKRMESSVMGVEPRFPTMRFIVIRGEGGLLGSVAYGPAGVGDPAIFPADWASIHLLAVAPEGRRLGVGKELTLACMDLARRDNAPVISLFTSELMIPAQRLYESLGFVRESEIAPRNGLRYFRYKLNLAGPHGLCKTLTV